MSQNKKIITNRSFFRPNDTPFEDGTFRLLLGMLQIMPFENAWEIL